MNSDQLDEVWAMLDRAHLERVARQGPPPVFATISGAHLYGFASPDSDVDLRGAFLLPAREMLGLHPPKETREECSVHPPGLRCFRQGHHVISYRRTEFGIRVIRVLH